MKTALRSMMMWINMYQHIVLVLTLSQKDPVMKFLEAYKYNMISVLKDLWE